VRGGPTLSAPLELDQVVVDRGAGDDGAVLALELRADGGRGRGEGRDDVVVDLGGSTGKLAHTLAPQLDGPEGLHGDARGVPLRGAGEVRGAEPVVDGGVGDLEDLSELGDGVLLGVLAPEAAHALHFVGGKVAHGGGGGGKAVWTYRPERRVYSV